MVGYVCMTPAAWAPPEVLHQRKDAYIHNVSTSHWPHEIHRAGAAPPFTEDKCWRTADRARRELVVGASAEKALLEGTGDGGKQPPGLRGRRRCAVQ